MSNPQPGAGHVRIKVTVCGVCRTDLHTVERDIHPSHIPTTPGHQVVGTIDSIFLTSPIFRKKQQQISIRTNVLAYHGYISFVCFEKQ